MPAHTPAPWEAQGLSVVHVEPMDNGETLTTLVASCHTTAFENGEQNANARLIAAAPDMLAALESLADYAEDCANERDERPLCIDNARAAIARVTEEG